MKDTPVSTLFTDHDTLVQLDTKFELFSRQILEEIKDLKEGTQIRLSLLEERMKKIEDLHTSIKPIETAKKVEAIWVWKDRIEANLKFSIAIGGVIGGALGTISTLLVIISHLVHI